MTSISKRIRKVVNRVFPAANPRCIPYTQRILIPALKDKILPVNRSHVTYKFQCNCGASYIGMTVRKLSTRIKEHLPRWLINRIPTDPHRNISSSIGKHILTCNASLTTDAREQFTVLASFRDRMKLAINEAISIAKEKPTLCIHREFDYTLSLPLY